MTQNLVSSAPGIYQALLSLVQTAAGQQQPPVNVFPFEPGQYVPGSWVTVQGIENHEWEWESIGSFSQKEHYDVCGQVVVYTGDTVTSGTVPIDVLTQTYSLFQAAVMTPVMSNRTMPLLGTTGPSPFLMLPGHTRYAASPGEIGGEEAGWLGVVEWSFHFDAYITPA